MRKDNEKKKVFMLPEKRIFFPFLTISFVHCSSEIVIEKKGYKKKL